MTLGTKLLLRKMALKYETAEFLNGDPAWFMHQVEGNLNKETFAFIASCFSFGTRKQFFPKIQFINDCAKGEVYEWILNGSYRNNIPDNKNCYYRLFNNHNILLFLDALSALLNRYGSIGDYVSRSAHSGIEAVEAVTSFFSIYDINTIIPKNTSSACKRINMFLRWMVRDHSPVDLGLWNFIDKRTLIMPLDTHVLHEAVDLNITQSRSTTMKAAQKLTILMAEVFPDDPLKGDFALFGYGINK
jgi:uncharacterized protein (TIGR02757 family)